MSPLARNTRPVEPSHGGRGTLPPLPFDGDGGGGGRGDGDHHPDYGWRLKKYRLGLAFVLISVAMLFISLSTLLIARKAAGRYDPYTSHFETDWVPTPLPMLLLSLNTVVLLLSSFTLERARRKAQLEAAVVPASRIPGIAPERDTALHWVYATATLGMAFLAGQWMAWNWLLQRDIWFSTGPSSSFVFLMTGLHGLHLLGGILVLLYACLAPGPRRSLERRRITIDITGWYWHFMALLWFYLFGLLWYLDR